MMEPMNRGSHVLAGVCPFKIGVAVSDQSVVRHRELILRECTSVTFENALKLNYRLKADNSYDFSEADRLYEFAAANGLAVRGHVIAWHIDFPEDTLGTLTRDELLGEVRRYIKAVAARYPLIYAWDIVNEIIDGQSDHILKKTPFYRIIGEDYVERIFEIAREEFGCNVALYWNEDDEWRLKKPAHILKYAAYLVKSGVPVDGIGLQCHISPYEKLGTYRSLLDGIRRLGLRCQITEMEVSAYDFDVGRYNACPDEVAHLQANTWKQMFELFLEYSDIIDLVCFWSMSDQETWRDFWPVENRKDWPTLFDEADRPKPVYAALYDMAMKVCGRHNEAPF